MPSNSRSAVELQSNRSRIVVVTTALASPYFKCQNLLRLRVQPIQTQLSTVVTVVGSGVRTCCHQYIFQDFCFGWCHGQVGGTRFQVGMTGADNVSAA